MAGWISVKAPTEAAIAAVLNQTMPAYASIVNNSPNHVQLIDGFRAKKSWTLDGDGAQVDDAFVITGGVYVRRLGFFVTEATDTTDVADVGFHLFDQVDIRALSTATLDCSTCVVGTMVYKGTTNGSDLIKVDPTASLFGEAVIGAEPFHSFTAVKQDGAVTEIRLVFNGDVNTDCDITAFADYVPISDDGAITAAP
ncbi:MAG: hypothetical protein KAS32_19620 [Candidatus Peribacteraceae bacterium]|nr:hypothetical protein [Candidatus Peribacteraceae bacterium]